MADPKNDEAASRIEDRVDNAKTVNAVPSEQLTPEKEGPTTVGKTPEKKPKNPEAKGKTVAVDDPLRNDNRKAAEDKVVREHGEDIRDKGNFEELVQEELVKL